MAKALMISALVGGVCGLLSCFMTLKGWALMGDAVSHAVLPGVVVPMPWAFPSPWGRSSSVWAPLPPSAL